MARAKAAPMTAIVEAVFQRHIAYSCRATEGNPLFVVVSGMLCVGKACMPASVRFPCGAASADSELVSQSGDKLPSQPRRDGEVAPRRGIVGIVEHVMNVQEDARAAIDLPVSD